MTETSVEKALRELNQLKKRKVIKNYAMMGAYAYMYWAEPITTADLDILVYASTDKEHIDILSKTQEAIGEGFQQDAVLIDGLPVQLFPTSISPLFEDGLAQAKAIKIGNTRSKVVQAEHLILFAALANRPQDRIKIRYLWESADQPSVRRLVERFDDDEKTLDRNIKAALKES